MTERFENSVHAPLEMTPIPSPIAIVVGGPAAVSAAVTWPFDSLTTNECASLPPIGTVPVNVSLVGASGGVEGVVEDPEFDPPEHAVHTNSASPARKRFIPNLSESRNASLAKGASEASRLP